MTVRKIRQFTVISLLVISIVLFLFSFRILMKRALIREAQNFINETTQYCSNMLYSKLINDLRKTEELAEYIDKQDNVGASPETTMRKMKNSKFNNNFLLTGFVRPTEKGFFICEKNFENFEVKDEQRALFSKLMKNGNSISMIKLPKDSKYLSDELKNVSLFLYSSPC